MIVTLVRHNIFKGKTEQINNFYIIDFTICLMVALNTLRWTFGSESLKYSR
jgi:hypothetical protein